MTTPETDPVSAQIEEALAAPIQGWSFEWLRGRAEEARPPWSYRELARDAVSRADRVLDIDTGGGEFLSALAPLPAAVVATEGYPPNVETAARHLSPIGVSVVHAASAPDNVDQSEVTPREDGSVLPFLSGTFDLVIDRHASYLPSEVHRVLSSGGRFLTQQRGETGQAGTTWSELFGRSEHPHGRFTIDFAIGQLEGAGFEIVRAEEADTPMTFRDLAGVVYYLRRVPWAVERFDVTTDWTSLQTIATEIEANGGITLRGSQMLIDARKP